MSKTRKAWRRDASVVGKGAIVRSISMPLDYWLAIETEAGERQISMSELLREAFVKNHPEFFRAVGELVPYEPGDGKT